MTPAPIDCPLRPEPAPGGGLLVPREVTDRIARALNGEPVPEPEPYTIDLRAILDGPERIDSEEPREERIGRELVEACEAKIEEARARAGHGPSKPPEVLAWHGLRVTEEERERFRLAVYGGVVPLRAGDVVHVEPLGDNDSWTGPTAEDCAARGQGEHPPYALRRGGWIRGEPPNQTAPVPIPPREMQGLGLDPIVVRPRTIPANAPPLVAALCTPALDAHFAERERADLADLSRELDEHILEGKPLGPAWTGDRRGRIGATWREDDEPYTAEDLPDAFASLADRAALLQRIADLELFARAALDGRLSRFIGHPRLGPEVSYWNCAGVVLEDDGADLPTLTDEAREKLRRSV